MAALNASLSSEPISGASAERVDMKFEVVVIPVADVDRSKEFYTKVGWRLDADFPFDNGFRVVQFTPPGAGSCHLRLLRHVQRPGRQRVAAAGDHDPVARPDRRRRDDLRIRGGPGERHETRVGCARRAREAHRPGGPELARLVCRVHGGRAGGRRAADVSD